MLNPNVLALISYERITSSNGPLRLADFDAIMRQREIEAQLEPAYDYDDDYPILIESDDLD